MATWSINPMSGTFGTTVTISVTNFTDVDPILINGANFNGPTVPNYLFPIMLVSSTGSGPWNATWTFVVVSNPSPQGGAVNPPSPGNYNVYVRTANNFYPVAGIGFFTLLEPICFNYGTKILCMKDNDEVDIEIQNLKKGDLVKTLRNGYLPVNVVGKSICYNPKNNDRIKSRMYILKKNKFEDLKEDLVLTGCHSLLTLDLDRETYDNIKKVNGDVYVTDNMYRLPVYFNSKSEPYVDNYGDIVVYNVALGDNERVNYGIYANGLLVETCFIPKVKNKMEVISE
jgi:hypothetical protein